MDEDWWDKIVMMMTTKTKTRSLSWTKRLEKAQVRDGLWETAVENAIAQVKTRLVETSVKGRDMAAKMLKIVEYEEELVRKEKEKESQAARSGKGNVESDDADEISDEGEKILEYSQSPDGNNAKSLSM